MSAGCPCCLAKLRLPKHTGGGAVVTYAEMMCRLKLDVAMTWGGVSENEKVSDTEKVSVQVSGSSGTQEVEFDVLGVLPLGGNQAAVTPYRFEAVSVGSAKINVTVVVKHSEGSWTWKRKGAVEVRMSATVILSGGLAGVQAEVLSSRVSATVSSYEDWTGGPEDIPYPTGTRYGIPRTLDPPKVGLSSEQWPWERAIVRGKLRSRIRRPF